ncbi:hypothetical protein JOM56_001515 [Amanita muscaria]
MMKMVDRMVKGRAHRREIEMLLGLTKQVEHDLRIERCGSMAYSRVDVTFPSSS